MARDFDDIEAIVRALSPGFLSAVGASGQPSGRALRWTPFNAG
jgi:hypothetical protein